MTQIIGFALYDMAGRIVGPAFLDEKNNIFAFTSGGKRVDLIGSQSRLQPIE